MSTNDLTIVLEQCSLGSGAAETDHKVDVNSKTTSGVEATSFVSPVLGLYFDVGVDTPHSFSATALGECPLRAIGENLDISMSIEQGASITATAASRNDADLTSLSECPSPTSSVASSIEDDMLRTPPPAQHDLESLSPDGSERSSKENVDCFEFEKLEAINTIANLHSLEPFAWDSDFYLSAPRMLTIALPAEGGI